MLLPDDIYYSNTKVIAGVLRLLLDFDPNIKNVRWCDCPAYV